MKSYGEIQTVTRQCKHCNEDFTTDVLFRNGLAISFITKECVPCVKKQNELYEMTKPMIKMQKCIEVIRDLIHNNVPYNIDAHIVTQNLDFLEKTIVPRYFSQEGQIIRLHKTGNFMVDELAIFFGKTKEEVTTIIEGSNNNEK